VGAVIEVTEAVEAVETSTTDALETPALLHHVEEHPHTAGHLRAGMQTHMYRVEEVVEADKEETDVADHQLDPSHDRLHVHHPLPEDDMLDRLCQHHDLEVRLRIKSVEGHHTTASLQTPKHHRSGSHHILLASEKHDQ